MAQKLHEILKARRESLGWSQQRLADELGKSQMAVWSWEAGKVDPRAASLQVWAGALGVKIVAQVDPAWEAPERIDYETGI